MLFPEVVVGLSPASLVIFVKHVVCKNSVHPKAKPHAGEMQVSAWDLALREELRHSILGQEARPRLGGHWGG